MKKNRVLILSSPRSHCGIADYVSNLFNSKNLSSQTLFDFQILPLGFKNLITSPFSGFKIIHIQHEFFLFDRFIGISGIFWFFYLKFFSYFLNFKIVTTIHSPYNPQTVFLDFQHLTKNRFLLFSLKIYLQFYFWILFGFSDKVILLVKNKWTDEKIVTISLPAGIQESTSSKQKLDEDLPSFLTQKSTKIFTLFGFAFRNKGYETAILALAEVLKTNQNVFLVIISEENNYLQKLKNLVSNLRVQDSVVFTGYLDFSSNYLQTIFQKTDAFIFPFLDRNQASSSFFTTLPFEKPVIVSDIKIFKEYDFLLKFPEGTFQKLKEQMSLVLNQDFDKNIIKKMRTFSKETSTDKIFERHLEVYFGLTLD